MHAVADCSDPPFLHALSGSVDVYFGAGPVAVEELLTTYRRRARHLAALNRPLVAAAVDQILQVLERCGLQEVQLVHLKTDDDHDGLWLFDDSGSVLCTLPGPALPGWSEQAKW